MDRKRVLIVAGGFVALGTLFSNLALADAANTASGFSDYYAELAPQSSPLEPAAFDGDAADCGDTAGSCGCTDGCDLGGCCDDACGPYFVAGVEATFLAPSVNGSGALITMADLAGPTVNQYDGIEADGLEVGPRIWLGLQGECWGLTFRYWGLNGSDTQFTPFNPVTGGGMMHDSYDFQTIDLELSRRFQYRCTDMTASFGVRYAEYGGQNHVSAMEVINGNLHEGSALIDRNFGGTGLVFGLNGLRPIGCANWNLYWNLRGSILWGDTDHVVETYASAVGPGGAAASTNGAAAGADESMFIGEFGIGLQRDFALECIPATAFFRIGFEYQYWDADNNSGALAFSTAAIAGSDPSALAYSGDVRMDLTGFTIGTGLYW